MLFNNCFYNCRGQGNEGGHHSSKKKLLENAKQELETKAAESRKKAD